MIEAFVNNPVKVAVGVILVALFGTIALFQMPMELTPDVEIPSITIETRWPGAGPNEVEKEIVQEQEEQLQSVEGLQKMTSESLDSMGRIILEFAVGTNMDSALLMVSTRLNQVRRYPVDADEPVVMLSNSEKFIAWFILNVRPPSEKEIDDFVAKHPNLKEGLDRVRSTPNTSLKMLRLREFAAEHPEVAMLVPKDQDLTQLRRFADDFLAARFERVPGVANSNVMGGREDEMQVIVDPELLARSGLTIETVRAKLMAQNQDIAAGDLWEGKKRIVVRTLGQFRTPQQVEATILARVEGKPVYVRDVARVELGYKKPDGVVRRYGRSVVALNVQRANGANVLDVMAGLRTAVKELNEGILQTRGLELQQVYDETDYIYSSMNVVTENVLEGSVLSFIVLLLFLKNVRSSLVIFAAIATSMIGMFLMMGAMGRSLNLLSMAGIAFAVGMLVDNFIVVLENIFRHRQQGETMAAAVVSGTKEVWGAVVASTLANLAVFVPVLFVQDQVGQLFHDLALAIACALGLSLLVSIIVIPTAAKSLLGRRSQADHDAPGDESNFLHKLFLPFDAFGTRFTQGIVALNALQQKSVIARLFTVGGCLAFSLYFSWLLMPKVEYLPNGNRNLSIGLLLPPPGYNIDQLNAIGEKIEAKMRKYWDHNGESAVTVRRKVPKLGPDYKPVMENGKPVMEERDVEVPTIADFFYVVRGKQLFLGMRGQDQLRAAELVGNVYEATEDVPGMIVVAKQMSLFETGLGAGRTVDVEITGPDVRTLVGLARRVMGQVVGATGAPPVVPGAVPFPKPSADLSAPELHVIPRWDQAADLGFSAADLGYAVNALVDGAYAGDYNLGGDKIDLSIVGSEHRAKTMEDVRGLSLFTPEGRSVTLESVADVVQSSGPEQINRRERLRAITISVTPPVTTPIEQAMEDIQAKIVAPILSDPKLRGDYNVTLSGTADKLNTTWLSIRWNLLLAVIITYLVIAALFESWVYPLIIMLSVPLGAVGGIIGLWGLNMYLMFTGGGVQQLDMFTMVGFIILVGTVVNNPILIIEQALQNMRDGGMDPHAAILDSVNSRIRPIFMTALIGLLGLFPLVISPGAGSELYRGLGSVTLGGLVFSTFFTLFFIPALFSLCLDFQGAVSRGWQKLHTKLRPQHPPAEPGTPDESNRDWTPAATTVVEMPTEDPEPTVLPLPPATGVPHVPDPHAPLGEGRLLENGHDKSNGYENGHSHEGKVRTRKFDLP